MKTANYCEKRFLTSHFHVSLEITLKGDFCVTARNINYQTDILSTKYLDSNNTQENYVGVILKLIGNVQMYNVQKM